MLNRLMPIISAPRVDRQGNSPGWEFLEKGKYERGMEFHGRLKQERILIQYNEEGDREWIRQQKEPFSENKC